MESVDVESNNITFDDRPSPEHFDKFLPWACKRLQVPNDILVSAVQSTLVPAVRRKISYVRDKSTLATPKVLNASIQQSQIGDSEQTIILTDDFSDMIKIIAFYDMFGKLSQLKFYKNKLIPRLLFKVLEIILKYHKNLYKITIDQGIDMAVLHELNYITIHTVTDVCLDGARVVGAPYDMLLENQTNLNNLSVARCNIDNDCVKRIAEYLKFPQPASKTLTLLNLASNRITDVGAQYIAEALRTNRRLLYLNLADNGISDDGAVAILKSLDKFTLSEDELVATRRDYVNYLKEKLRKKPKIQEDEKIEKTNKLQSKSTKTCIVGGKKSKFDKLLITIPVQSEEIDDFDHPYSKSNTHILRSMRFCFGNNYLANLNLSYNYITIFSIQKLLSVLTHQKLTNRTPKGLVRVNIEGNCIPDTGAELEEIDLILRDLVPKIIKVKTKLSTKNVA